MGVYALSIGMDSHILDCMIAKAAGDQTMLGEWMKRARGDRSQTEVAARINMEQAEWSRWERGERKRPKPEQIRGFAFALGVPVESVALAYAGIWPTAYTADDPQSDLRMWAERLRALDLPPDVRYDELLMLKHLFRGVRGYESEARAERNLPAAVPGSSAKARAVPDPADQIALLPDDAAKQG